MMNEKILQFGFVRENFRRKIKEKLKFQKSFMILVDNKIFVMFLFCILSRKRFLEKYSLRN